MYDAIDHALHFPLKADVENTATDVYLITNIRQDCKGDGSLLPPIRLRKEDGVWVFVETESASRLSTLIGAAIDEHRGNCF
jgi:hypothetical protein